MPDRLRKPSEKIKENSEKIGIQEMSVEEGEIEDFPPPPEQLNASTESPEEEIITIHVAYEIKDGILAVGLCDAFGRFLLNTKIIIIVFGAELLLLLLSLFKLRFDSWTLHHLFCCTTREPVIYFFCTTRASNSEFV